MHPFKTYHEDGYDKINELSNFKCGLASFFQQTQRNKAQKNFRGPGTPS